MTKLGCHQNLNKKFIFVLNSLDNEKDINLLKSINSLVGSNLVDRAGEMRVYDVQIDGTN